MSRVIEGLLTLWKTVVNPPPHPVAEKVERAAEEVIKESRKLNRRARVDGFGDMVDGMRGESRSRRNKSKRGTKG